MAGILLPHQPRFSFRACGHVAWVQPDHLLWVERVNTFTKGGRTKPLRGIGACGWYSAINSALCFV